MSTRRALAFKKLSRHIQEPEVDETPLDDTTHRGARAKPERFWRNRYRFFEQKGYRIRDQRRSQAEASTSSSSPFPVSPDAITSRTE